MARGSNWISGFLTYVRPTFMLPAVGMSIYGGALARWPAAPLTGALHAGVVGMALFVAHLRDGYVDGHRRGEETPQLAVATFRRGIRVGALGVVTLSGVLFIRAGPLVALSGGLLLVLALLHAPYLDRHPLGSTIDYPIGIAVAILGGYAAQTGDIPIPIGGVAAAFVGLLSGIKIGIDRLDADFDGSIGRRTIPVAYGSQSAERIAVGVFAATAVFTAATSVWSLRPPVVVAAATVPIGCALATAFAPTGRAVRIQMGLTYAFAALLFVGICDDCIGADAVERAVGFVVWGG